SAFRCGRARGGPRRPALPFRSGSPAAHAGFRSSPRSPRLRLRGPSPSRLLGFRSPASKLYLNLALGGVHTGSDGFPLFPVDLSGPQVADLAALQLADAGVADPHAAAVG